MNFNGVATLLVALAAACSPVPPKAPTEQTAATGKPEPAASEEPSAAANGEAKAAETGVFLSRLPLELSKDAQQLVARAKTEQELRAGLMVRISTFAAYKDMGELTRRSGRRVVNGVLRLVNLDGLSDASRPKRDHQKSSFVIDYDEPVFEEVLKELAPKKENVSADAVEAFVNGYIRHKTYTRGFDLASQVASRREGDCTEHSVLTVALLRHLGKPARLVFGVVLVAVAQKGQPTTMMAAGHAWAESFENESWRIVDAALHVPQSGSVDEAVVGVAGLEEGTSLKLIYLPINVMKDEGPGYMRAMMDEAGVDTVVRIRVDAR